MKMNAKKALLTVFLALAVAGIACNGEGGGGGEGIRPTPTPWPTHEPGAPIAPPGSCWPEVTSGCRR